MSCKGIDLERAAREAEIFNFRMFSKRLCYEINVGVLLFTLFKRYYKRRVVVVRFECCVMSVYEFKYIERYYFIEVIPIKLVCMLHSNEFFQQIRELFAE